VAQAYGRLKRFLKQGAAASLYRRRPVHVSTPDATRLLQPRVPMAIRPLSWNSDEPSTDLIPEPTQ
jgi:hypothetical protein